MYILESVSPPVLKYGWNKESGLILLPVLICHVKDRPFLLLSLTGSVTELLLSQRMETPFYKPVRLRVLIAEQEVLSGRASACQSLVQHRALLREGRLAPLCQCYLQQLCNHWQALDHTWGTGKDCGLYQKLTFNNSFPETWKDWALLLLQQEGVPLPSGQTTAEQEYFHLGIGFHI